MRVLLLAALAALAAVKPEVKAVEGEIVDLTCYVAHEGKGKKHAKCGKECALRGNPVGLLSESQLYVLVEDHAKPEVFAKLREKVGEQARVEGPVYRRGGVTALAVSSAGPK